MGGHSKKSGKGGGGAHGRRDRNAPQQAKRMKKDPGVPDLKNVAERLTQTAQRKSHSVLSIPHMHGNSGEGDGNGSGFRLTNLVRGGGAAGIFGKQQGRLQKAVASSTGLSSSHEGGDANLSPEALLAERRREMQSLVLRTSEKTYDYEAPMQLYDGAGGDGEEEDRWVDDVDRRGKDNSLRRFFKEFHKVVEHCDVLLQVLDARDPIGCRLTQLEKDIMSTYGERKKVVVVLNKADMLPSREVLDSWIYYFESQEHMMCIPFAATAKGSSMQTYVSNLFKRLRALARNEEGERKAIVVGVIGYPNVGKSSIINALKRKNVVGVGNMPGFTTGNTEVELRSDIRVMDCPGVVTPGEDSGDVVLRNAIKVSELANPFLPVQRLLQRCTAVNLADDTENQDVAAQQAMQASGLHPLAIFYGIGHFNSSDVMDFIHQVGMRRGRLTKGGLVDEEGTARMILTDWNDGRIPYYTYPPAVDDLFLRGDEGYKANEEDDDMDNGGASSAARLVRSMGRGVTFDGLPTFHLQMSRITGNAAAGKKKWKHVAQEDESDGYDYEDDEEVL